MGRAFSKQESLAIRERLLEAGRQAVAATGLRKTPVGTLTRAAGISQGAFYTFFESKEALLVELLRRAEAEVRQRVDAVAKSGQLSEVIQEIFDAIPKHPLLRPLSDPDELGWLTRVLGARFMQEARAADDAWFLALGRRLQRRGLLARGAELEMFASLPHIALGVAQQRQALGDRFEATVRYLVDTLASRLQTGVSVSRRAR
jgi:TetR/AcrR family transcriptional regulator